MKSDFHFLARSLGPSSWFWCPASAFIRVTHALHPQLRSTWPLGAADGDPHPEQEPGFERNPTEQPMWLVKVPRYLSQPWSGASGSGQVGKLQMARDPGKSELFFTLQEELTGIQDAAGHPRPLRAPGEHPVLLRGGRGDQRAGPRRAGGGRTGSAVPGGTVVQRLECRPAAGDRSWRRKGMHRERPRSLVRTVQVPSHARHDQLQTCRQSSVHMEYEKKRKEDGKRGRTKTRG